MTTPSQSRFPLARAIAMTAVGGAVLLIALDFASGDAAAPAGPAMAPLERRLKSFANINLFVTADVPGGDLRVSTGTEYADAQALADGRAASRWCYVERTRHPSSYAPHVDLGKQEGDAPPTFIAATGVAPDQAMQLGLSKDALATLGRRYCRFGA